MKNTVLLKIIGLCVLSLVIFLFGCDKQQPQQPKNLTFSYESDVTVKVSRKTLEVKRGNSPWVSDSIVMIEVNLLHGGLLQTRVSETDYRNYIEKYVSDAEPQHVKIGDTREDFFSIRQIYEGLNKYAGTYYTSLRTAQESYKGQIIFKLPSGIPYTYAVIQLPQQLMDIQEKNLPPGYSQTFTAKTKIYGSR